MAKRKKEMGDRGKKNEIKTPFYKDWISGQQKRMPIIKFVLGMTVGMILFFAISSTSFFEEKLNLPLVIGYAWLSNMVLNLFGLPTNVAEGTQIVSAAFNINVAKGCDAVSPIILFLTAIAVYPTAFSNKWKWMLLAPLGLGLLNVVRIVSLYLLGVYMPSLFDFAHYEFWQGAFILVTIVTWFYWLLSVLNKNTVEHEIA